MRNISKTDNGYAVDGSDCSFNLGNAVEENAVLVEEQISLQLEENGPSTPEEDEQFDAIIASFSSSKL
jgi:hypothetical protein